MLLLSENSIVELNIIPANRVQKIETNWICTMVVCGTLDNVHAEDKVLLCPHHQTTGISWLLGFLPLMKDE